MGQVAAIGMVVMGAIDAFSTMAGRALRLTR